MISVSELKKIIPQDSLKLLEETFNPAIFNQILLSFRIKRKTTFRINTLKANKSEVIERLRNGGFKFKNIDFLTDCFQLDNEENNKLLKSEPVKEGKIYLQSISSLLPPVILAPEKNDKILDIAAAPGSKTTQISALLNNTGSIDAIEPDYVRMERLTFNTNLLGAKNINFCRADGINFCKDKKMFYDRVLADVPCSGEGRFSCYDKNSYGKWKRGNIDKLSGLQKKLLKSAIMATKINGIILYSTCTLNVFENEKVINEILKESDFKVKILPVDKKFKSLNESIPPIINWKNEKYDNSILNCLRIIPSANMEGFFICKMQKIN